MVSKYGWLRLAPPSYKSYIPPAPLPPSTHCTNYKILYAHIVHRVNLYIPPIYLDAGYNCSDSTPHTEWLQIHELLCWYKNTIYATQFEVPNTFNTKSKSAKYKSYLLQWHRQDIVCHKR